MKVLGIGNAIVDVLCKVSDEFLENNSLTKSTMKLVNEDEFHSLISSLKIEETISGGSVANSIVGLSQLENEVGFLASKYATSSKIFGRILDSLLNQKKGAWTAFDAQNNLSPLAQKITQAASHFNTQISTAITRGTAPNVKHKQKVITRQK